MKYWDIKPMCPTAHQHYQIRRWLRSLPTRGFISPTMAVLIVEGNDPCRTRILKETLAYSVTLGPTRTIELKPARLEPRVLTINRKRYTLKPYQ